MTHRVYNFSAGPATLPLPVLERVQAEFLDFRGVGASVIEISHRSAEFETLLGETDTLLRELMAVPPDYHILYAHGGAQMQFSAVPLNLIGRSPQHKALYVDSGVFAARAIAEARRYGTVEVAASSADSGYDRIPALDGAGPDGEAAYLHITTNNTVMGTRWPAFPDTGALPLVGDATSEILSRPIDLRRFGLLYAGAQKNLGPPGLAVVLVREDLAGHALPQTPHLLDYAQMVRDHSLTNTINTFAIHVMRLVLDWVREQGGVAALAERNERKAQVLYDVLDASGFYTALARPEHRSVMNVTFDVPSEELRQAFLREALEGGLYALKGHKARGGLRASIYNAMPEAGVAALADFMRTFEQRHG